MRAAIAVVFLPMVPTDGQAPAASAAKSFDDTRTSCFWDSERTSGVVWSEDLVARFGGGLRTALASNPDHAARLAHCIDVPRDCPTWDAAFFYEAESEWSGDVPQARWWTKQFGFERDETTGRSTGTFWRGASPDKLVPSSWEDEFAAGMATVAHLR